MSKKTLEERHKAIRDNKNVVIQVYTNASGYLWAICKADSGTDLGFIGDCDNYEEFNDYDKCMEDIVELLEKNSLEEFAKKKSHWSFYATYMIKNR